MDPSGQGHVTLKGCAGTEVHRQGQGRQHHREGSHGSALRAAQGRNSFPEQ